MFYNEDESLWVKLKISRFVNTFSGHDGNERSIIYLGSTPLFILKSLLIQKGIILEEGLSVKVLYFGPEIASIKMSEDE